MTKADLERFKSTLLALRSRSSGDVSHLAGEALGPTEAGPPGSPADSADQGSDLYEQECTLSLLHSQEQTLKEIDEALARIEQGKFGRCEECGEAILRPRLVALPYTRHCVSCARKLQ